jgi:hypothetical protein
MGFAREILERIAIASGQPHMKKMALVLMAAFGFTAHGNAQTGWTLEKCEQHYGKPEKLYSGPDSISYHFVSGQHVFTRVSTSTHLVTGVSYSKLNRGPLSMDEIKQLLQKNGPGLEWSAYQEENPARSDDKSWIGKKDGKTILRALYAHLEGDGATGGWQLSIDQ